MTKIKCDIVNSVRSSNSLGFGGYGAAIAVTTCRTHGVSVEGILPIKDDLCIVGRIERLERLCEEINEAL